MRAGAVGRAHYLGKNRTTAEAKVWRWLSDRKLGGWKFRQEQLPVMVESVACFDGPLTPSLSRRERAIERSDLSVHLLRRVDGVLAANSLCLPPLSRVECLSILRRSQRGPRP